MSPAPAKPAARTAAPCTSSPPASTSTPGIEAADSLASPHPRPLTNGRGNKDTQRKSCLRRGAPRNRLCRAVGAVPPRSAEGAPRRGEDASAAQGGVHPVDLLIVSLASLFAGFVDAIVGGGGLILVPALFAVFPHTHPATLFGVNKSASVWGTSAATLQYARRVRIPWRPLLPAAAVCFAGAMAGAWTVTVISPD